MTELLSPTIAPIDAFDSPVPTMDQERFDLITFPEAFVPAETLVAALATFPGYGPSGCIHVGLRPSNAALEHLFTVGEMRALVDQLTGRSPRTDEDLAPFAEWLDQQGVDHVFNIGCLFAVDADGALRICLHPKIVRSQFETNPLPEKHMHEADLLTLVTLLPVDKRYTSISLQPLICSDALNLKTDRAVGSPMVAVNRHAACLGASPPDHIDIVSVASCTPQPQGRSRSGRPYREWHEQFQDAFRSAASHSDYARHHFAAVVLANFQEIDSESAGGLSGIFLPVPPRYDQFHPDITVSCWGKDDSPNNGWSRPDDNALRHWKCRGFIAGLDPFATSTTAVVRIFGFNIQRLPRENSLWSKPESLTECEVRIGERDSSGRCTFSTRTDAHV